MERVTRDIGIPCDHSAMQAIVVRRLRGLCIPAGETKGGTFFMNSDDSWYDESISHALSLMAAQNPEFVAEFSERALKDHDPEYIRGFWQKVKARVEDVSPDSTKPRNSN